jgi:hypothetical protein
MFFSVGPDIDRRFPNNHQINNLWVNCDNGWQRTNNSFYKGYEDNYCQITVDFKDAIIEHSRLRSFPLFYQTGTVTNLDSTLTPAWTDDAVSINVSGKVTVTKIDIDLTVPSKTLTVDQAVQQIRQQLDATLTQVPDDIKLFCSGGVDTLLLYAMLSAHHPFELVVDEHYEPDEFTKTNQLTLSKFWGYQQIHHWTVPTWLATGSHGDEYFLRGPAAIAMLTAWHNINFGQLLADNPDCYHYKYFNRYPELWTDSWINRAQLQEQYPTVELLNRQVLNTLVNDHQHWHLGNTITWTPFKNIELVKILLQCNIADLLPQFLDGQITKTVIKQYSPELLEFVSKYKNYNSQEHLTKLVAWHNKQKI